MKKLHLLIFVLIFTLSGQEIYAQKQQEIQPGATVVVILKDGSQVNGELVSENAGTIVIRTEAMGEVTLDRTKIKSITKVSGENLKKGKIWFENPNPYRYLLGNSAIPKPKKTATYQNVWIFFNSFSYAPTNFLDLSGGFEMFSLLSASSDAPYFFYLNPKVSTKVAKDFYVGGNIFYLNSFANHGENDFYGLGSLNGFATYGNTNKNITGSLGWGFVNGTFEAKPIISVGGMIRASRRIGFVSENWFIPDAGDEIGYYGLFSYGIRFMSPKVSIDLAFINNGDIVETIPIGFPFLDFVVIF